MQSLRIKASNLYLLMGAFLISTPAFAKDPDASTVAMPWEAPLEKILSSLRGGTAKILITLAIVLCGFGFAFGEQGSGFKKFLGMALGGSIVIMAVSFVADLFGASF